MIVEQGWDSITTLVEGRWIERRPRRPTVAAQLLRECRLLPWLAPQLPLPVPVPAVRQEEPLVVRHEAVVGAAGAVLTAAHGRALGSFLVALHGVPVEAALAHGLAPAEDLEALAAGFRSTVLPLVPAEHRAAAAAVLDALPATPADAVVHGDLGPEHVLVDCGQLTGVIDFGDACLGDAAIDLAWVLHGAPSAFAAGVAAAYRPTVDERERALLWHRLGPWYAVEHGLRTGDPAEVADALAGVIDRL